MYFTFSERKNRERRKLVCEDLSPILKENQSDNRPAKFSSRSNWKNTKSNSEDDSDDTKDLVTRLNTVNIDSGDTDEYLTACSETEVESRKDEIRGNKDARKSPKKYSIEPLQKENNVSSANQIGKLVKSKIRKTKEIKTKITKKDSFIVSDNSSISNDSITIYHQLLSKDIRTDVRKITPRARLRKSISTNDDGIFTPYIFGKRSSSESSFSDEEVEVNDNPPKLKLPKSQIRTSLFSDQKLNRSAIVLSEGSDGSTNAGDLDAKNDSSDLFSKNKPKKKNRPSSKTVNSPVPAPRNLLKDLSWVFTDDNSSETDDRDTASSKKDSSPVSNVKVIRDDKSVTLSDKKLSSKEKPGPSHRKASLSSTPITFRLKQVKNLTPKEDKCKDDEPMSFLKSLSNFNSPHELHPDAERYKKKFKKWKEELALRLFKIFNEQVFDSQLPSDLKIEWSARLRSSSGLCYNRRIKNKIGPNNECLRTSRIALSTKIIETPDRLRDTLIHEMCHAAAWIIDNKCDGHGPRWRSWAAKAMRKFPELPLIRRCHDYAIKTKFNYKCVKCGYTIGRHSKSLNLERKRCGYCYGKFELILNYENVTKSGNTSRTNTSPKNVKARPLSKFALFVKDNYGKIKAEKPDLKHGEIMKELSKNFASTKISSL